MVRKFLEDIFRRKLDVLHSARIVHTLYHQQKQGKYCDLKVLVENQQYFVHRCVLASASSQLDAQINGHDTIQLVGVTNYGFEMLLEILYTGKMSKIATIGSPHFHQIVSAADALNAESVIEYCARERADLMKIVLDQPDEPKETKNESSITETAITESLAVDSPTPIFDGVSSGGNIQENNSSQEPRVEKKAEIKPAEAVEESDWKVKVKNEPIDSPNPPVIPEKIVTFADVSTSNEETAREKSSSAEKETPLPYPNPLLPPSDPSINAHHEIEPITHQEIEVASENERALETISTSRISMMSGASPVPRGYKCGICRRIFSSSHHLKIHMKKHGSGTKPFKCETCGMRFSFHATLANHMKLHDVKRFHCQFCGRDFKLHKTLKLHLETVHTEEYGVNESLYSFPKPMKQNPGEGSSRRKSAPAKRVASGEVIEDTGTIDFYQQGASTSTVMAYTTDGLGGSMELEELKSAAEQAQAGGDGKYPCPLCGKGFSRRWNLKCHVLTHAENHTPRRHVSKVKQNVQVKKESEDETDFIYICPLCGKSFQNLGNLRKHATIMHRNSEAIEERYNPSFVKKKRPRPNQIFSEEHSCWCDICGRGFRRLRNLRSHMETHTGGGYECHICGRTFAQKDGLNGHLWIHGGATTKPEQS